MPWRRAAVVWLLLVATEFVHGIMRSLFLAPRIGDWPARQVSVLTGSILIVAMAWLTIGWLRPTSRRAVMGIGVLWLVLMVSFELFFGRVVLGLPWSRIQQDYDMRQGGFLSLGMLVLAFSPWIASRLRGRLPLLFIAATLATASLAHGQTIGGGDVLRLDPALDRLVPPGSKVEKLAGTLQRAEGPVWIRSGGYLLLSDFNEIMKWVPGGPVSIFRSQIFSGIAPSRVRVGTNGLTLDRQGRLVAAEPGNRRISRFDKDGKTTVLAAHYMGKRLNSPNDLVMKKGGDVYFTDPPYFASQPVPPGSQEFRQEIEFNGVYRVTNARNVELLVKDLGFPNGLAFSPNEQTLYVADSRPNKKWMAYDVNGDGTLGRGRVFLDLSMDTTEGVPDGMKVDTLGNVYATGPAGVLVISPGGKHLGTIQIPEVASNCAWGDADGKTLYVTARTGLYRIKLNVAGIRP